MTNDIWKATTLLPEAFQDILISHRSQIINLTDVNIIQPLEYRINQIEASIKRMTGMFQSSLAQDQSTFRNYEPSVIEQKINQME